MLRVLVLALSLLSLTGCRWMSRPAIPMRHASYDAPASARGLVVLLPGVLDHAEDFQDHGLVERIQAIDPSLDVVTVDAHLGYYLREIVGERLHHDVIARHLESVDYDRVWLVGVSLGGLGALSYVAQYPNVVDGVILLSPYLGSPEVIDEIRASGGLDAWRPRRLAFHESPTRRLSQSAWLWCRDRVQRSGPGPQVYLGYGTEDELRPAHELLGESLPAGRSVALAGGHTWTTWRPLFDLLGPQALAPQPVAETHPVAAVP